MTKNQTSITVQGTEITIYSIAQKDYISLTDIAKYRNNDAPADVVKNWLRSRSTIEFLGLWEKLNNPDFKLVEFDQFVIDWAKDVQDPLQIRKDEWSDNLFYSSSINSVRVFSFKIPFRCFLTSRQA